MRAYDKIPKEEEWTAMKELSKFPQIFKTATEVLNGEKYSTIGLILLFKTEIENLLTDHAADSQSIQKLKSALRSILNTRIFITEIHLCAAMLDPSMRNIKVIQDYMLI